jgi:hypothetical protein
MKQRYRMFPRGSVFYAEDTTTGKQESLKTKDRTEARRLLAAKNEAHVQPALNLHIARAYLSATVRKCARAPGSMSWTQWL